MSINISDSQIQTVSLMAYGSGTTIVSDPPLAPAVKLGPQFSCQPVKRWFHLANSGRRPQQIYWTTEGFLPYRAKKKPEYNPDDMRFQVIRWKDVMYIVQLVVHWCAQLTCLSVFLKKEMVSIYLCSREYK